MKEIAFVVGAVIGFFAAVVLLSSPPPVSTPPLSAPLQSITVPIPNLSLDGFSPVEIQIRRPFIFLIRPQNISCNLTLSAITDDIQLNAIDNALQGQVDARPAPHELMADALKRFGVAVDMVQIDRLDGTVYLAHLILRKDQQLLSLDARPSDAIAIALRAGAPTYIQDGLFEKNAKAECS